MAYQARFAAMSAPFPGMDPYLQQAFAAVYDLLGYNLAIDYTTSPEVPLEGETALAAEHLLRAAGLRSA
jgi:hypothetical protein